MQGRIYRTRESEAPNTPTEGKGQSKRGGKQSRPTAPKARSKTPQSRWRERAPGSSRWEEVTGHHDNTVVTQEGFPTSPPPGNFDETPDQQEVWAEAKAIANAYRAPAAQQCGNVHQEQEEALQNAQQEEAPVPQFRSWGLPSAMPLRQCPRNVDYDEGILICGDAMSRNDGSRASSICGDTMCSSSEPGEHDDSEEEYAVAKKALRKSVKRHTERGQKKTYNKYRAEQRIQT